MADADRGRRAAGVQFWREGGDDAKRRAAVNAATRAAGLRAPAGAAAGAAAAAVDWRSYIKGDSSTSGLLGNALKYLFYAAIAAFVLFIILTIVHFTVYPVFSFIPGDGGIIPIPTFGDSVTLAKEKMNPPETALPIQGIPNCGYTIAFDLTIPADFTNLSTPRVLVYRAAASKSPITGLADSLISPKDSKDITITKYTDYLKTVYDATNFIIWLDPTLNDLYVSAIVQKDGATKMVTTDGIPNLPTKTPTRVAVVFTELFCEIYVNGRLKQTKTFKDAGTVKEATGSFFTTPVISGSAVALPEMRRVSYWPRAITAGEIAADGSAVPSSA